MGHGAEFEALKDRVNAGFEGRSSAGDSCWAYRRTGQWTLIRHGAEHEAY